MKDSAVPDTVFVLLQDENDTDCHEKTAMTSSQHMPAHMSSKNDELREQVENVSQRLRFGETSVMEYSEGTVLNSTCWYSQKDLRKIQKEVESVLVKLYNARMNDETVQDSVEEYCERGLVEGSSFNIRLDRFFMDYDGMRDVLVRNGPYFESRTVVGEVLSQQEEHRELGINDPACLRTRMQSFTDFEKDRAIRIAHRDFEEAVSVWKEDKGCAELLQQLDLHYDDVTVNSKGTSSSRAASVTSLCDLFQMGANKNKMRRSSSSSFREMLMDSSPRIELGNTSSSRMMDSSTRLGNTSSSRMMDSSTRLGSTSSSRMDSSSRLGTTMARLRASLHELDYDSDLGF